VAASSAFADNFNEAWNFIAGFCCEAWARSHGEAVMKALLARFAKDESGATAIEYAIIAGGLSIVIVVAVGSIGTTLNSTFTTVAAAVK
jgi:pilus assembly protein Flp/PilA